MRNNISESKNNNLDTAKNPVLDKIIETGFVQLEDGSFARVSSHIDENAGRFLQKIIREIKPSQICEIGLAFGISTLYMLEALDEVEGYRLIGMDPAQNDNYWRGGGLNNIRRSGFGHLYEFYEESSQLLLPKLTKQGVKIQLGFIDGWHTFDHTLIDFFYLDMMLEIGGVIVFDDVGYPAIRRVCDFVLTNRSYEIADSINYQPRQSLRFRAKQSLIRLLNPIVRTNKSPTPEHQLLEARIENTSFLALRKISDDARCFDHFIAF